jgi:hypothetical protein
LQELVPRLHINLQGEYNFSDDYLKDAFEFGIDDLLSLQIH